jgi:rhodanese-related sulfurtransferase
MMRDEGALFLDVRTPVEFHQGHPAGAYNVPLMLRLPEGLKLNESFINDVGRVLTPKDTVVLGCKSGARSARAAQLLLGGGFAHVFELASGFEGQRDAFGRQVVSGWKACGLPVAYDAPETHRYQSRAEEAS